MGLTLHELAASIHLKRIPALVLIAAKFLILIVLGSQHGRLFDIYLAKIIIPIIVVSIFLRRGCLQEFQAELSYPAVSMEEEKR